jgi:hypothetical protein
MQSRQMPAVYLQLKPSKLILGCYVAISITSISALLLSSIAVWLKLTLAFVLIITAIYALLRDVLLCLPWSWQRIEVSSKGKLLLCNRRHQIFEARLKPSTLDYVALTVLHFERAPMRFGFRNTCWMTSAQVHDQAQYRRFRVWLKWGSHG